MRNTILSYLLLPCSPACPSRSAPPLIQLFPSHRAGRNQGDHQRHRYPTRQARPQHRRCPDPAKELNGIGRAKAEAIVAYREANGPFASVDELLEIKGIGNALLERNRDKLVVTE